MCIDDVKLIPGNGGRDCPGDGAHCDEYGAPIECQCDECDYLMLCAETEPLRPCKTSY